jgi:hypothetical protein
VGALSLSQVESLSSAQIAALSTRNVRGLSATQLPVIKLEAMAGFETRDVAALGSTQLRAITGAQMAMFNARQIAAISVSNLRNLGQEQLGMIALTAIEGLSSAGIAVLSSAQLNGMTAEQIKAFSAAQVRALTTAQLSALKAKFLGALSEQALTSWLTASQCAVLGLATPLVLDLNGGGVSTRSLAQGVLFDLDGDGTLEQTAWVGSGDGLLVRDLNGNGRIDSGRELFGSSTELLNGDTANDGFQALAALDSNADGRIDQADEAYASLRVWVDANSDGVSAAGELYGLAQAGVRSISLAAEASTRRDQGNIVGLVASFERTDGESAEIADVWFQHSSAQALDAQAAELAQALSAYALASDALQKAQPTDARLPARAGSSTGASTVPPGNAPPSPSEAVASLSRALQRYELDRAAQTPIGWQSLSVIPEPTPLLNPLHPPLLTPLLTPQPPARTNPQAASGMLGSSTAASGGSD